MKIIVLLLLAISAGARAGIIDNGDCYISLRASEANSREPAPLYLTSEAQPKFLLPNSSNVVPVTAYEQILLGCSGKDNQLEHLTPNLHNSRALCLGGRDFYVSCLKFDVHSARCKRTPEDSVWEYAANTCLGKHRSYDLGFKLEIFERDRNILKFASVVEVCRDEETFRTYYSKMRLAKEVAHAQSGESSEEVWKYGAYYPGYDMDALYRVDSQLKVLETILGSTELAHRYIRSDQYLVRGQLSPESHFFYATQRSASFWQLNAEPRWVSVDQGNWRTLENDLKSFAISRQLDLDVYTGVHGVASLKDGAGEEKPLYLQASGDERALPVARFHWKVIHDPASNRATAFVVLNDPHAEVESDDMFLCTDISSSRHFDWLKWDAGNIGKGLAYVCTVEELRNAVPTVPVLGETAVL